MATLAEIQKTLKTQKPLLAKPYGIRAIGVFGSYIRQEQRPDSDIDILIDLDEETHVDLLDIVRLQNDLTDLLGVQVGLAIKRNLRKRIGRRILDEVVLL